MFNITAYPEKHCSETVCKEYKFYLLLTLRTIYEQ